MILMRPSTFSLTSVIFSLYFFTFNVIGQGLDIEEITVEPYIQEIERTGKIAFKRTLSLSFKSNGYLTQLAVDEGDVFVENQVLASLEISELNAEKNAAFAKLLQAKREVTRIKKLMAKKVSSEKELDQAGTAVETARSAFKIADYNLQRSQIKVPFAGVVLSRSTELGEYQTPGREILEVAALQNNLVVKVALTGSEISQVSLGQNVAVELPLFGQITGKVSRIPAMANNKGNLFTVDVLLPDIEHGQGIFAGQLAVVHINTSSSEYVYRLPIGALVGMDDQNRAIVVVQNVDSDQARHQAFEVFKVDSRYVYLSAEQFDDAIRIVTQGWQHIRIKQ